MQLLIGVVVVLVLLLPWNAAAAEIVAFADGSHVSVQGYELKGNLVVMTTLDGKLRSVPLSLVDLETTERLNRTREPIVKPPPDASVTGGEPRVASLRPATPSPSPPGQPAQRTETPGTTASASTDIRTLPTFSPPAPRAPEVMTRDSEGRITLRATRVVEPIVLDGKLDDLAYARVKSVTGFIQQEPDEGEPASEETEAWIFFDDRNFYVGVRCWDSHPERMIANEMRRDHNNIRLNENMVLVIDTDYDRRNGFYFGVSALAALRDMSIGDEGQSNNVDWNTVWDAKSSMDDQGWMVEIAIPFKSLRFKQSGPQVWSINLRRTVAWKTRCTTSRRSPTLILGRGCIGSRMRRRSLGSKSQVRTGTWSSSRMPCPR